MNIRLRQIHIARLERGERESLVAGDVANELEEALEIRVPTIPLPAELFSMVDVRGVVGDHRQLCDSILMSPLLYFCLRSPKTSINKTSGMAYTHQVDLNLFTQPNQGSP